MNAIHDHEMVKALKMTGTGDFYLAPLYEYLGQNQQATANDAAGALTEAANRDPAFHITAAKAREIARGKNPMHEDFQGKPPKNQMQEAMKRDREELAKMTAKVVGEAMGTALSELKPPPVNPAVVATVSKSERQAAKQSA